MLSLLMVLAFLFFMLAGLILLVRSLAVRLGGWGKAYFKLAKRYGATVSYAGAKPRMAFNYSDTHCMLRNVSSRHKANRKTQLTLKWPDRKFKLFVSTHGAPSGLMRPWNLKPVSVLVNENTNGLTVLSNDPGLVAKLLTPTTFWQIQQLVVHTPFKGIELFLNGGQLKISNPGHIKEYQQLDDFVRFGLELYDQFKLANNNDLEFVSDDVATVFTDVTCPICSEQIDELLVTCVRCKTPHCADCWEYNGQCATFACNETRFLDMNAMVSKAGAATNKSRT